MKKTEINNVMSFASLLHLTTGKNVSVEVKFGGKAFTYWITVMNHGAKECDVYYGDTLDELLDKIPADVVLNICNKTDTAVEYLKRYINVWNEYNRQHGNYYNSVKTLVAYSNGEKAESNELKSAIEYLNHTTETWVAFNAGHKNLTKSVEILIRFLETWY